MKIKIAISTDGDQVSMHFGRCPSFAIAELDGDKVITKEILDNPGHHPGFLPKFLQKKGVSVIVAGGMGTRARELFDEAGIKTVTGVMGGVDEVIGQISKGTLKGGESLCKPGAGKGYGVGKTECDHTEEKEEAGSTPHKGCIEKQSTTAVKICVTACGNGLEAAVDPRFGRARYFIIVEPETLKFEAIENPNLDASGGAGIQSAQFIAGRGVKVVLTGNVGPNAFKGLEATGVKIITGTSGTVMEALAEYKKGRMKPAGKHTVAEHSGM